MSRSRKTEGIVLKRRNLGEADKILTLYTKHYGKIQVIAKGVRKITSRKGGNVELFNHLSVFLYRGRNLDILTEVQTLEVFKSWRQDLRKVAVAYYFCELVNRLTPDEQANREVFELLRSYLKNIGHAHLPTLIRSFEEHLLTELGFGIPEKVRRQPGSLKNYLETIAEKEITTPRILKNPDFMLR